MKWPEAIVEVVKWLAVAAVLCAFAYCEAHMH